MCKVCFCFFSGRFPWFIAYVQHPVLIPAGALLNVHHPFPPPPRPPSTLSLFSVFNRLLWFASLPEWSASKPPPSDWKCRSRQRVWWVLQHSRDRQPSYGRSNQVWLPGGGGGLSVDRLPVSSGPSCSICQPPGRQQALWWGRGHLGSSGLRMRPCPSVSGCPQWGFSPGTSPHKIDRAGAREQACLWDV